MTPTRSTGLRFLAAAIVAASLLGTFVFAGHAWGSLLVLRSAYQVGVPAVSSVRPWMTLDYVATTYGVPLADLRGRLDLAPETAPDTVLRDIAGERDIGPIDMVRQVQSAIAALSPRPLPDATGVSEDAVGTTGEGFLVALLAYSYPALALVLLLGAIGAPVPIGLATILAGSLSAGGGMDWPLATAVAVAASLAGDTVGYGIGRLAGDGFVTRHGHLFGYAGSRRQRVEWLFHRWGGITVLLTRTLVSHLSSLASLLAGLSRYALLPFMLYATLGRVLWTAAYLGLGYFVGSDLDAASGFLASLTGLIVSLAVAVGAATYVARAPAPVAATRR